MPQITQFVSPHKLHHNTAFTDFSLGTHGRIEIEVSFNASPEEPCRMTGRIYLVETRNMPETGSLGTKANSRRAPRNRRH